MPEKTRKQKTADLSAIIGYLTRSAVGCLVMMWAVINLIHNFLSWRNFDGDTSSWWITIGFIIVVGVTPLFFGLWLLTSAPRPK